jgi:carboxyl-terminal processing protease
MPRRNLFVLVAVTLVALLCYQRVQKSPYGRVLTDAITRIENRYLEPIGGLELFEGAMEGMVSRLDDHSAYVTPAELQAFHESIDLEFVGVGMEVGLDSETKQLMVLAPLVGSPAFKAGIRAGDRVLRIGEASTQGMSLMDAVSLLHGQPGVPVTLTVLHEGEKKPTEIKIVRSKIQIDSVLGDRRNADGSWNFMLDGRGRIGYVRIASFTDKTADEFAQALKWLSDHGVRGLVLDLRDDPGGYLSAAIDVCDQLIRSGLIVTTRPRDGRISRAYSASGRGQFTSVPMAVLVNQQTASAAEIVAACLQDYHRAVIVGQRSYGKGTVQEVLDLEKGCGALKLTTASYWRPSGKNINRPHDAGPKAEWGVSPNEGCKVALGNDEQTRWRLWRARRDAVALAAKNGAATEETGPFVDRPLARAVEYLEKEASGK